MNKPSWGRAAHPKLYPLDETLLPIILDGSGDKEYTVAVFDKVYANPETSSTEQTNNVVSETWSIQASGSQSNVSVTIEWDGAEEETGFNRAASYLSYWEDGVSSVWDVGTSASATVSGPYSLTRTVNFRVTYSISEWGLQAQHFR